jgi:hypothetical protein
MASALSLLMECDSANVTFLGECAVAEPGD